YLRNLNIPSQSTLNSLNNKMKDGLTKTVQPIWRPDTKFQIIVKGKDKVDDTTPTEQTYTIYFQTQGVTGFFTKEGIDIDDDKFMLGRIQGYIDYDRSHPQAAGQLMDSKPLYYEQSVLNLFYRAPYMNLMFDQWSTYLSMAATEYGLRVQVMDSRTNENVATGLQPSWTYKSETKETQDVRTLNNLLQNGPNCFGDSGNWTRKTATAGFELPDLLPANLYTATYYSINKNPVPNTETEVHKHVFQTSRFPDFATHIASFSYLRPETTSLIQINENFDSGSGAFTAASGSALLVSEMILLESSHHPSCLLTIPVTYGVPYEVVPSLKGYSYNFGGKTEFFCKTDGFSLYSNNILNQDREPQDLIFRFYSEKTGNSKIELGMKNNKIGTLQHFVLDEMKVRIPAFDEILLKNTFSDSDTGSFIGLSGSTISNISDALHIENVNDPKAGVYFDVLDGITYTISFDLTDISSNGGGSTDLICKVGAGTMLSQTLIVSTTFPQTLTCSFIASGSGTQLLELAFDMPAGLGTTEFFDFEVFKIEHSLGTAIDIFTEDFSTGNGDVNISPLSHTEPTGVLYIQSVSGVPETITSITLVSGAKYTLKFKVSSRSYNGGELKIRIQTSLFDVDLDAVIGSEISYDFETTTTLTTDLSISLKDTGTSGIEYLMIDDLTLVYVKTEDTLIQSLYNRNIELSTINRQKTLDILNDSDEQDLDLVAKLPLKYDRIINGSMAPLGSFQACERLEIHRLVNTSDSNKLVGLLIRSPEPLFFPALDAQDLADSLEVICELSGSDPETDFIMVYAKDRSSVFITTVNMDMPSGEYHFNFKYLTYNGAEYAIGNPTNDQSELVVNI
ncbi:MAG TPA: hypothetical protein VGF79_03815, partial [Bacteroidia bacterium]